MREIELKNNTSGKKILVDDITPDLSLIPSKDNPIVITPLCFLLRNAFNAATE